MHSIPTSKNSVKMPHNYHDGQEVRLGDRVRCGQDSGGIVVAILDTGEYEGGEHCAAQWGYLKQGVMIAFPLYGVIHYAALEPDIALLSR